MTIISTKVYKEKYKNQIENIVKNKKVILSDIFDTILVRVRSGKLVDYYESARMVEEYLPEESKKYVDYRRDAGHAARKGYDGAYYSIDDIKANLPVWCGYLVYFEEIFDIKLLQASVFGGTLLSILTNTPQIKYFLTDTYYRKEQVQKFLDNSFSYSYLNSWKLLCSATDKVAKADGTMYDLAREQNPTLDGKDFIMFSDRVEDLEMAAQYEIEGILVEPEISF